MKLCTKEYCISKSGEIADLFNMVFTDGVVNDDKWKPNEIEEALCDRIKSLNWKVILVEKNKKIIAVGASALNITSKAKNNIKLFEKIKYDKKYFNSIKWLAVDKEKQQMGIGNKILKKLLKQIKNQYIVTVSCSKYNVDYYKKFGFEIIGKQPKGQNPNSKFYENYLMALKGTF